MNEAVVHAGMDVGEALTASDGTVRIMARLSVSQAAVQMGDWINAEIRRPDFDLSGFLVAVARFHVQLHASILHNFIGNGAFAHCAEMYRSLVDLEYVEHAERARQHAEERA